MDPENETATENETISLWNKKPEDMTVGDSLVFTGVAAAICVAAPFVAIGVVAGCARIWDKIRRPKLKLVTEVTEIQKNQES
jgi:hypothetical protein